MGLSQEEIDACREAFNKFDKDCSGNIDINELRATLNAMGQNPTDEELFHMMNSVDEDKSGEIEFTEFLKVIENQKEAAAAAASDADTVEAFVALGGNIDRTGTISADKLRNVCKEFGLTIDIDKLIRETDTDGSGEIDYEEFKGMLA
mmetsp:Transcript_2649/g.9347  ORF Transcript_2649/g.9347 Transcript_2649/m.9347 type:complete len:148 (-) Transcript_2649:1338-1781(-)